MEQWSEENSNSEQQPVQLSAEESGAAGDALIMEDAQLLQEEISSRRRHSRRMFAGGLISGVAAMLVLGVLFVGVQTYTYSEQKTNDAHKTNVSQQGILSPSVQSKIRQLVAAIDSLYYEEVDEEELVDGLYKGLFEGIGDPYSAYYTPEEYESMMISATASLSGIGAVLQQDPDTMQVTVNHVYEGSPAEQAGIRNGDMLLQVDDITATSMELSELVTHIRGKEGTVVHLKLYREGLSNYLELDVTRAIVDVPTVSGEMQSGGIGYIAVVEFGENTAQEFKDQVAELQKQGMTALIVDLRDNPGGMLASVTDMLDQILPEGVLVSTEDKYGEKTEYTSDADCMDLPMAVLINGNSASSSEIFAGAIRDYDYGTLIGTKTFGKGIVQSIRRLKDGSAIKLTTAKYYTPHGENIHGQGIEPDIELEYDYQGPEDEDYDMKYDNQVQKAIEILKYERR